MKPDIIKAIQDGNLFRSYVSGSDDGDLASWRNWIAFLKVLYGLKPTKAEHEVVKRCTGRDPEKLGAGGYTEALLLCGRRSGKSKTIAMVGAAEAVLSGKEARLSAGEIGMLAIISPTRFQSRIIHNYMRAVFQSSPILEAEVEEEKREGFKLKNGIEIAILTGSHQSTRGFSLIGAIVDEVAFFGLTEESKVKNDTELIRALRPALATTGGRLFCSTTPFKAAGYCYQTFKRAFGQDDCDVLCWNAPSLLMNPRLSEAVVQRAIAEDSVAASVEYCTATGLFREDVDEFISRAVVEALVVPGRKELPPRNAIAYSAFCDVSGGRQDDAAVAIAHKEDRVVVLDCLERFKSPHNPYEVVAAMAATLRRYGCDRAIGDAYAAEWSRTAFASHGILYNRASTSVWKERAEAIHKIAKPKAVLYAELLPRLTAGEVELLDDDTLIVQLASLQRRTRSGGRDSIDHPPGGHDDLANCLAGVCDAVGQRPVTAGTRSPDDAAGRPMSMWEREAERMRQAAAYFGSEEQEGWRQVARESMGNSPRLRRF